MKLSDARTRHRQRKVQCYVMHESQSGETTQIINDGSATYTSAIGPCRAVFLDNVYVIPRASWSTGGKAGTGGYDARALTAKKEPHEMHVIASAVLFRK